MEKSNNKKLKGVIPALILPLHENGRIHFKFLEKQVRYLISEGVNGLFVNGTTGEGAWLTLREKEEAMKCLKEVSTGEVFICAACLQPTTEMAMSEMNMYEKYEPDYLVAVTPYYYTVSQEVIIEHFKKIARASPIPLIIYNIPQCTHNKISLDTILELAKEENIAGVKDSSGDFISFSRGIYTCPAKEFSWIQGEDYLDGPSFNTGADGIVTGLGNVDVHSYVQMYRENEKGNVWKVNKMQQKINQLYEIIQATGGKVIPSIKAGASLFNRSTKWMKMPDLTLSNEDVEKVKEVISELQYSLAD